MRASKALLLCLALAVPGASLRAQTDSLWSVWKDAAAADSSRLKAIQALAWRAVFELPDSGITLAFMQLDLATRAGNKKARYEAYTTLAAGHSMKGDYRVAIEYLQQCLRTAGEMNDPGREANTYSNMSNAYKNIGDLPMALEVLQKSLRIDEGLENSVGLAGTYNNIGNIHMELGDHAQALEYYQRSAALYDQLHDLKGQAQALLNLGVAHAESGERLKALEELTQSKGLYQGLGRKLELGMVHNNLGHVRGDLGDTEGALRDLDVAEALLLEVGNKRSLARTKYYKGLVLLAAGKFREAIAQCTQGLRIAEGKGMLLQRKECNECLMSGYEGIGDHKNAFLAQRAYLQTSDSIAELNNSREVMRLEVTRTFHERMLTDSLEHAQARFHAELEYQANMGRERDKRNLLLVGGVGVLALALGLWSRLRYVRRSRTAIQKERDRSDELLHNILPEQVAAELKRDGSAKATYFEEATILFSDFKGFTQVSEQLSPTELVEELNVCFKAFDGITERFGLEKIKTIGDAYMAAAGLPDPKASGALEMVEAALAMQDFISEYRVRRQAQGKPAFGMRIGIHTGPVVAGIVGYRKFAYDVWGDTVNVASRMESSGEVGRVNISGSTRKFIQDSSAFRIIPRGMIQAKGKGDIEMFFVERIAASTNNDPLHAPHARGLG